MTTENAGLFFRIHFEIEAPDFWGGLNRDELEYESPTDFVLQMTVLPDDDDLPQSITKWRTNVVWTQVVRLRAELYQTLQRISEGPSFCDAMREEMLDTPIQGHPRIFTFGWMPKGFFGEMLQIHKELDRAAFKVIDSLFWRVGVHCGPSRMESDYFAMEYSLDGENFDSLPFNIDFKAEVYKPPPPKPIPHDFPLSLENIKEAPVHHALFREAWKALDSEIRVAIVMATAAVESAVKHLISTLLPGTSWLLENTPSPPIVNILRELLNTLEVKHSFKGKELRPPKDVITAIQKLVLCRNKIVHGSKYESPSDADLKDWLISVRDVLWLVDYYCGHEWASDHISPTVVEQMKES